MGVHRGAQQRTWFAVHSGAQQRSKFAFQFHDVSQASINFNFILDCSNDGGGEAPALGPNDTFNSLREKVASPGYREMHEVVGDALEFHLYLVADMRPEPQGPA